MDLDGALDLQEIARCGSRRLGSHVHGDSHTISLEEGVVAKSINIQKTDIAAILSSGEDHEAFCLPFLAQVGRGQLQQFLSEELSDSHSQDLIEKLRRRLLSTICSPAVIGKHLTAACNVLAIFIRGVLSHPSPFHQEINKMQTIWVDSFKATLRVFDVGKTKPALQILDSLIQAVPQVGDRSTVLDTLRKAVHPLLHAVMLGDQVNNLKESLVILAHLLRRSAVNLTLLLEQAQHILNISWKHWRKRLIQFEIPPAELEATKYPEVHSFLIAILMARVSQEAKHAAIRLFSLVSGRLKCDLKLEIYLTVKKTMEIYMVSPSVDVETLFQQILPSIITTPQDYRAFLESFRGRASVDQLLFLMASLRVAQTQLHIGGDELVQNFQFGINRFSDITNVTDRSFDFVLRHGDSTIRSQAYNILLCSSRTTSPISGLVLECVHKSLRYLHDEGDSHYRGDVLSTTRKLVHRLNDSLVFLQKQGDVAELEYYYHFLQGLRLFLIQELYPNVSYQRHVMALHFLKLIFDAAHLKCHLLSSNSAHGQSQEIHRWSRHLVNLLFNPFEDVRESAQELLYFIVTPQNFEQVVASPEKQVGNREYFLDTSGFTKYELMASSSCRNDDADGLGRLYGLSMSSLEFIETITRTERFVSHLDRIKLPSTFPLHGMLLALKYYLEWTPSADEDYMRVLAICENVWNHIQEQLCVDSPEFAAEEGELHEKLGPKDMLAYSWRALRDSSLLIHAVIRRRPMALEIYSKAGALCIEQLSRLRHRGAFSVVTQTFAECCQAVEDCSIQEATCLRRQWYECAVSQTELQGNRLTRRSAGIPALVACCLKAEDLAAMRAFIESFVEMASRPVYQAGIKRPDLRVEKLPQVHALNCLREVMTNSRFRSATECYILLLLKLSSSKLSSTEWVIRNCALMLFRACATRIDRKYRIYDIPRDVPSPVPGPTTHPFSLALLLLEEMVPNGAHGTYSQAATHDGKCYSEPLFKVLPSVSPEKIFATLHLVSQLNLSPNACNRLRPLVAPHLGSSTWAIRERTAEVLVASLSTEIGFVELGFDSLSRNTANNWVHGWLLQCKLNAMHLLRDVSLGDEKGLWHTKLSALVLPLFQIASDQSRVSILRAAAMEILNLIHPIAAGIGRHKEFHENSGTQKEIDQIRLLKLDFRGEMERQPPALRIPLALQSAYLAGGRTDPNEGEYLNHHDQLILQLMKCDVDAAKAVLHGLHQIGSQNLKLFSKALTHAIDMKTPDDLCADLMSLIASTECTNLDVLQSQEIDSLRQKVHAQPITSRDIFTAKIKLQPLLFALTYTKTWSSDLTNHDDFRHWLVALRYAASDEVDMPTREVAAQAIFQFVNQIYCGGCLLSTVTNNLDLLVILYDLTQDDDKNIRSIAARTVCILSGSQCYDTLCSLKANEVAVGIIRQFHTHNTELTVLATKRLLGSRGNIERYCQRNPVSRVLERIIRASSDLFAEEKQNLYLDQLRNLQLWDDTLQKLDLARLSIEALTALVKWIEKGIECITNVVSDDGGILDSFPLGPTFNADIQIICIRVILLAGNLAKTNHPTTLEGNGAHIKRSLKQLHQIMVETGAHEIIIHTLDTVTKNP